MKKFKKVFKKVFIPLLIGFGLWFVIFGIALLSVGIIQNKDIIFTQKNMNIFVYTVMILTVIIVLKKGQIIVKKIVYDINNKIDVNYKLLIALIKMNDKPKE